MALAVRACSVCGAVAVAGSNRCGRHPKVRVYDTAGYRRARAVVKASASVCVFCGEGSRPDDPWTVEHVLPVVSHGGAGPLRAAHRSCNSRAGQALQQGRL